MRTRTKLLIAVPVVAVVAAVGGPFVYINLIKEDAPPPLAVSTAPAGGQPVDASTLDVSGEWTVGEGSQAGYRAKEVLFGQSTEGVGRTGEITGGFTVTGTSVEKAAFTVDMASVTSDSGQRDNQFRNRIMDVEQFPTAVFTLTEPVSLPATPADQATVEVPVTGTLLLHGTTKPVSVTLTVKRDGQALEVAGSIPVTFGDYGIDNPSGGPAQVGDDGQVELLLKLVKA